MEGRNEARYKIPAFLTNVIPQNPLPCHAPSLTKASKSGSERISEFVSVALLKMTRTRIPTRPMTEIMPPPHLQANLAKAKALGSAFA